MSTLNELIKEKYETNYRITRDRYISMCIIHFYKREHDNDKNIYDCFAYHQDLATIVCSNHLWEPYYNGYLTKTDYRYDEKQKKITFTIHRIIKKGDKYVSDGSKISDKHLNDYRGDFTALAKADSIINSYYLKNKEAIDRNVESVESYKRVNPNIIEKNIEFEEKQSDFFFKTYGQIGINLLVKWLNKLNNSNIDINDLISDFKNDVLAAKIYLDSLNKPNYVISKRNNIKLDDALLKELERYSSRSKYLKKANNRVLVKTKNVKNRI